MPHAEERQPDRGAAPETIDLGRMRYADALAIQRQRNQAVIDGDAGQAIYLVEHEPVITISHRKTAAGHLLAAPALLEQLGIEVCETDRGGDITYHGPGQLVVYPILRLADWRLNLSSYMRTLEQVVIDTLQRYGVEGVRDPSATGVWVPQGDAPMAKVCAMGVRIRKNTTMHGLALNVTTDLNHFATIVPCGLAGRPVTSLAKLCNPQTPAMADVKATLVATLLAALERAREGRN